MANVDPVIQPVFDTRIYQLYYPLGSGNFGNLKRGHMIWEKPGLNYTKSAEMHFLYNPSTVTADYYMAPDSSVAASLLFPTAFDSTNLRVPLNQQVTWSLLFDRTYELWGQYHPDGTARQGIGSNKNNPAVIGVRADILQMQQFTGMQTSYDAGTSSQTGGIAGNQGIIQLIPSYVFFGGANSQWFYGYISEWDVTITHWTQFMIPMRCVINITFTMLPSPRTQPTAKQSNSNTNWSTKPPRIPPNVGNSAPGGR